MPVRNALEALTLRPTEFLRSAWPWRSLAYLSGGALLGLATMVCAIALILAGALLSVAVIGLAAYVAIVLSGVVVARMERRRMRLVDMDELPDPHRPVLRPGVRAWLSVRLREQVTWRELGYAMLSASLLCWMDSLVVGVFFFEVLTTFGAPFYMQDETLPNRLALAALGVPFTLVLAWPVTAWAAARAAMARAILAPRAHDADVKLIEVTRSRARLVDAFEVERRRIERDLHDGAQQRMVAMNIQLGMALVELGPDDLARRYLVEAQALAKQALTDMRELIRGVHPKVLTDRGLPAAAGEVASTAPLPVDLHFSLPGRLSAALEITAYFVIAEALANVTKHSGATRASISGRIDRGRLIVDICDDGRGGADPAAGSGLLGLADRVSVLDGTIAIASPPGGPTILRVEIPIPPDEQPRPAAHGGAGQPRGGAQEQRAGPGLWP